MNNSKHVKKRINLKAVLVVIGALVGGGGAVHFVHAFQVQRNAAGLRDQAELVEQEGKLVEAIGFWQQYVGMAPEDTDALARYGTLLDKTGKKHARIMAFGIFETVLRREGQREAIRRRHAKMAMELGKFADAKTHLTILLNAKPDDDELLQLMAHCFIVIGEGDRKYDQAADLYLQALKGSHRADLFLDYADLLREKLEQPDTADAQIEAMVAANEQSPTVRLEAARFFSRFKEWDRADKHLTIAIDKLEARDAEVFLLANEVALARGKSDEARKYLEKGQKFHPEDARLTRALVRLDLAAGKKGDALKLLKTIPDPTRPAAKLGPETSIPPAVRAETKKGLWDTAQLLLDLDQPDNARKLIQQLEDEGATIPAAFLKARLAMKELAWAQARLLLEGVRGSRLAGPDLTRLANLQLVKCYEELDNPDLRLEACNRALQGNPKWIPARRALAASLAAMGKVDDAIQQYRELVDEDIPGVRIELARLLLIRTLRQPSIDRDWAAVEKPLNEIPAGQPGAVAIELLRADILLARDRFEEARKLAEKACDRDPKQFAPWMFLVNLAQIHGQPGALGPMLDKAEKETGKHASWALARIRLWAKAGTAELKKQLPKIEDDVPQYPDFERVHLLFGLGDTYDFLGDVAKAEQLWERVAKRLPHDIHVRFRLLESALRAGKEAQAQRWLEQVKHVEGPRGAMGAYGDAAFLVLRARSGDMNALSKARPRLAEAAALRPSWGRIPLLEATILEMENQTDKALEKYQAALERGEGRLGVVRHMVWLLYEKGRYAEADALLRKMPDETLASAGFTRMAAELSLLAHPEGDQVEVRARALELARKAVKEKSADYRDYVWLGLLAAAAEQPEDAEKALRTARDLKPHIADTWAPLIVLLARTNAQKAELELQEAEHNLPKEQSSLVLAAGYEALGKVDKAEQNYQAALAARPADLTLLRNASGFYRRIGQPAKAEGLLRKILEPATGAPEVVAAWARRNLALTLAASGRFRQFEEAQRLLEINRKLLGDTEEDRRTNALVLATQPAHRSEAIRLFETLSGKHAPPPETQFLLATLYEAEGNWPMAKVQLEGLIRSQQNNGTYLARLVDLMLRHKEADEALPYVQRLAKLKPNLVDTVVLHTCVLKETGREAEALNVIHEFARREDSPLDKLAYLYEELGQKVEAEKAFRDFAAASKRPEGVLALAAFLARADKTAEALDICEKAWEKCAPEAVAFTSVAVLRAGHTTEAQQHQADKRLHQAIAKYPTRRALVQMLAECHDYLGHTKEAVDLYRQLLKGDPRNVPALNNLAVMLSFQEGQGAEALRLIDKAIEIVGPEPQLLDTRAMVHLGDGHPDLALKDLEEAVHRDPSPLFRFHMARAYHMSRLQQKALEALTKAKNDGLTAASLPRLERQVFERLNKELSGS